MDESKVRRVIGSQSMGKSKLTSEQQEKVRAGLKRGLTYGQLAYIFKVSRCAIYRIAKSATLSSVSH